MGITSNANSFASAWKKRAKALESHMQKATADATKTLHAESKKQMKELIYDKPVPTNAQVAAERGRLGNNGKIGVVFAAKSGASKRTVGFTTSKKYGSKKAWHRTNNLKDLERFKLLSTYVGVLENTASKKTKKGDVPYARYRHKMKCRYPAPWRDNAIKKTRAKIHDIYVKAIRESMKEGLIGLGGF